MNDFPDLINRFSIYQCSVCKEAWPINQKVSAVCKRCKDDKQKIKKYSNENFMIPGAVPSVLENLTQIEEMLIARVLPITHVYLKPGGQRGYSGHCINLPQNVLSIAYSLPRYPKDLSVVIVSMKGKDNNFKHVTVRRQKVADAISWLIDNNQHYKDVSVNLDSLNKLPDCGIPSDLKSIEADDTEQHNSSTAHVDLLNDDADDVVYSEGT